MAFSPDHSLSPSPLAVLLTAAFSFVFVHSGMPDRTMAACSNGSGDRDSSSASAPLPLPPFFADGSRHFMRAFARSGARTERGKR